METLVKISAAAILSCAVCLLLKKSNPELAIPLSLAVCAGAFILSSGFLSAILSFMEKLRGLSGLTEALFYPVVKSVGIGICAKLASEVCKDSGQAAMAGCVELAGAVCALYTALPLMESLLDMLEELL